MNRAIVVVRSVAGMLWLVQLALGVLFWTGRALGLIPAHMVLGMLFVLALWTLPALGARAGAPRGLVALVVVWGAITPILGFGQLQLMPGQYHWVVRVLHLIVGLVAMPLAGRLSAAVLPGRPTRATPPLAGFSAPQPGRR